LRKFLIFDFWYIAPTRAREALACSNKEKPMLRRFQLAAFVLALTLGFSVAAETLEPAPITLEAPATDGAVCPVDTVLAEATQVLTCIQICSRNFRACFSACQYEQECQDACEAQMDWCVSFCP
jgi:hypothetical protein